MPISAGTCRARPHVGGGEPQLPPTVAMLQRCVQEVRWPRRRAAASTSPETSASAPAWRRSSARRRSPSRRSRRETCGLTEAAEELDVAAAVAPQGEAGSDHEVAEIEAVEQPLAEELGAPLLTSRVKLTTPRGRCPRDERSPLLVEGGQSGGTLRGRGRALDWGSKVTPRQCRRSPGRAPCVPATARARLDAVEDPMVQPREAATVRAPGRGSAPGSSTSLHPRIFRRPSAGHDLRGPEAEAGHLADGDEVARGRMRRSPPGEGRRPPGAGRRPARCGPG